MLLIFDLKWIFQDIDDQLTEINILKNRYKIYRQTLAVFEVKLL